MVFHGLLYVLISSFGIAAIGIFVKLLGNTIHVLPMTFFRTFIAALFVGALAAFSGNSFSRTKKELAESAILGFLFAGGFAAFQYAFLHAPVSNVILIGALYIKLVVVFGYLFLKEKPTTYELVAILVGLSGLAIINPFSNAFAVGNIFAMISAVFLAALTVYIRANKCFQELPELFWAFAFASLLLLPFPFIFGIGTAAFSATGMSLLLGLGILSTGVTYIFYIKALDRWQAEHVSALMNVAAPLMAIALAALILQEQLVTRVLVGGSILVASGILLELKGSS